jgi:hypothetical protein
MSHRALRMSLRIVVLAAATCLAGSRPQCGVQNGLVGRCGDAPLIAVEPGTCTEIENPCGGTWDDLLSLSFVDAPAGFWFEVRRRPTGTTVSVCVADTVGLILDDSATVHITDTSGESKDADVAVSTVIPLSAFVTADPETVTALDTLSLTAHPRGGVPPYTYLWFVPCSEGDPVGDNTQQSVLAYGSCEKFYLFLADAIGTQLFVETAVPTYAGVSLTAEPDTIAPGGISELKAYVAGGEIVHHVWWNPSAGLSNPQWYWTTAQPESTTMYKFHAVTDRGLESTATLQVTVQP